MVVLTKQRILKWFENHDKWVNQAKRAERLGKVWTQEDKLLGVVYHSITELDLKAEEMSAILKNPTLLAENEKLAKEEAKAWKAKIETMRGAK
jgi:hypothetical protein